MTGITRPGGEQFREGRIPILGPITAAVDLGLVLGIGVRLEYFGGPRGR